MEATRIHDKANRPLTQLDILVCVLIVAFTIGAVGLILTVLGK